MHVRNFNGKKRDEMMLVEKIEPHALINITEFKCFIIQSSRPLPQNLTINCSHTLKLSIWNKIDHYIKINLSGVSEIHFINHPPKKMIKDIRKFSSARIFINDEEITQEYIAKENPYKDIIVTFRAPEQSRFYSVDQTESGIESQQITFSSAKKPS